MAVTDATESNACTHLGMSLLSFVKLYTDVSQASLGADLYFRRRSIGAITICKACDKQDSPTAVISQKRSYKCELLSKLLNLFLVIFLLDVPHV